MRANDSSQAAPASGLDNTAPRFGVGLVEQASQNRHGSLCALRRPGLSRMQQLH